LFSLINYGSKYVTISIFPAETHYGLRRTSRFCPAWHYCHAHAATVWLWVCPVNLRNPSFSALRLGHAVGRKQYSHGTLCQYFCVFVWYELIHSNRSSLQKRDRFSVPFYMANDFTHAFRDFVPFVL